MAVTVTLDERAADYLIAVTVSGLSGESNVLEWTLYRDALDGDRVPVRGYVSRTDLPDVVAYDYEAPLARPVFYVVVVTRTDLTRSEWAAGPVQLDATHPVMSNPLTGDHVTLSAVEAWPELAYSGRSQVIPVIGRAAPVVVSDSATTPSSQPILRTDTLPMRRTVRDMLTTGQVVLLRAPEPDVEDTYLVATEWSEVRVTTSAADVRRRHQLTATHVEPPSLELASPGDTLADLAAAVPTTLLDLSAMFPTLLDVAAADLAEL